MYESVHVCYKKILEKHTMKHTLISSDTPYVLNTLHSPIHSISLRKTNLLPPSIDEADVLSRANIFQNESFITSCYVNLC